MALGDIYLNMGSYYAHLTSSGTMVHSIDAASGYSETATLAHTPGVLWRASGSKIERRDDTTFALLSSVAPSSAWGYGIACYRGNAIATVAPNDNINLQFHHLARTGTIAATVDTQVADTRPAVVSIAPGGAEAWLPKDIWSASSVSQLVRVSVTGNGATTASLGRPAGFDSALLIAGGLAAKLDGGFWVTWATVTNQSHCVITEHAADGGVRYTHDLGPSGYASTAAIDVDATDRLIALVSHDLIRWRLLRIPPGGGTPEVLIEQLPSSLTLDLFKEQSGALVAALHVERPPYDISGSTPQRQLHFLQVRR